MFAVDTNVLVYASYDGAPEHTRCKQLLDEWQLQSQPWYVSWGTLYEFLRVTTHRRILPRPLSPTEASASVAALLSSRALSILTETDRHREILADLVATVPHLTGNLYHDAHLATLMIEHGISRIYTRDTDFHRFPGIEVIDPLG